MREGVEVSISIARTDRPPLLALLRKLLLDYLISYTQRKDRDNVIYHLEWLGRQPGTMMLGVKFDTETKLGVTQIVIEIGFEQGRMQ